MRVAPQSLSHANLTPPKIHVSTTSKSIHTTSWVKPPYLFTGRKTFSRCQIIRLLNSTRPLAPKRLEGLDNVEIQVYTGVRSLARKPKIQADGLVAGGSSQFAVFRPVTRSQFSTLDRERHQIRRYTRIMYSEEERTMIIKLMPAAGHKAAYTTFFWRLTYSMA